jgi:hypothetical protein
LLRSIISSGRVGFHLWKLIAKEVSTSLGILKLPEIVQGYFSENERLTKGHATPLTGLGVKDQVWLIESALMGKWSVRRMEEEAIQRKPVGGKIKHASYNDSDIKRLSVMVSEVTGCEATITMGRVQPGKDPAIELRLKTWGLESFDGLLERLGVDDL